MSADHRSVPPDPSVSYLARDYDSILASMLERIQQRAPDWTDRSAADPVVTLVEALASAADQLAYFQDAVATESYLRTARLRSSVRRHGLLVGHVIDDGCSARAYVQVTTASTATVPAGTVFEVGAPHARRERGLRPSPRAVCFESIETATLQRDHNEVPLAGALARGATTAVLASSVSGLEPGTVVAVGRPQTWQLVRITAVRGKSISWHASDALLEAIPDGRGVLLGNLVLVDHGLTLELPLVPVPERGTYRPQLAVSSISRCDRRPRTGPAAASLASAPDHTQPQVVVFGGGLDGAGAPRRWTPVSSLARSSGAHAVFAVEVEDDGPPTLLFGGRGAGLRPDPGSEMTARVRVGCGTGGNVGAGVDCIAHVPTGTEVTRAWMPCGASGGRDPSALDEAKMAARAAVLQDRRLLQSRDLASVVRATAGVGDVAVSRDAGAGGAPHYSVVVLPENWGHQGASAPAALLDQVSTQLRLRQPLGATCTVRAATVEPAPLTVDVTAAPGVDLLQLERHIWDRLVGVDGLLRTRPPGLGETFFTSAASAVVRATPGVRSARVTSSGRSRVVPSVPEAVVVPTLPAPSSSSTSSGAATWLTVSSSPS